ncbi:MAG: thioredoxin domain-containing protein [Acutalibacteraceae bacterium]
MSNRLQYETSPYLLQHRDNPVDWYPWGDEAFKRAKDEDKPIFLSIGYSACHWCHVFAHESFEDGETAEILNRYFISVKVDKEERPDIDSVYMAVCQAFTGSGGWPTSIFMTAEQKPFFAGTYFPKTSRGGMIGFKELLIAIHEAWENNRSSLLEQSDNIINHLNQTEQGYRNAEAELLTSAVSVYRKIYDKKYGGFGTAPKFPTPHNLLFLLNYYERCKEPDCLQMAENTLLQMYRGGMFDHIGFGFCRYSTDKMFLIPHFEKMLYDNALLILAYCKAYSVTDNGLYLEIAEKTAAYILREMTSKEGGFFSAQDADSEGEEGKYYLFTPAEIVGVLGKTDGENFNRHFDITDTGNFEGKSIPNLLYSDPDDKSFEAFLPKLQLFRKNRYSLHLDDKLLTSWNSLMIAAMCELYLVSKKELYLSAAQKADCFLQNHLCENDTLFVSFRESKRGVMGFLDDYAAYIFADIHLYRATLNGGYLKRAKQLCDKVISDFSDKNGGFYLYSNNSEELILRPKETYDGAIPGGNSLMAYNFVELSLLSSDDGYKRLAERQLNYIAREASFYPTSHAMFLTALLEYYEPPMKVTVVTENKADIKNLPFAFPADAIINLLTEPTKEYPLKNGKTTYYVCQNHTCKPPTNHLNGK